MLLAAMMFFLIWAMWGQGIPPKTIYLNEFLQYMEDGKITVVKISGDTITGIGTDGREYVIDTDTEAVKDIILKKALELKDVNVITAKDTSYLYWNIFLNFIPTLLFIVLIIFMFKQMSGAGGGGGQAFTFAKSKAKLFLDKRPPVTFDDVAGADEAKQELMEVVDFLKNPAKYKKLGARIPKGVLLVGPPGCGKTLLARATAGEAGVPFFSVSGSEFVELFVGVGAARVRDLFQQARKHAPCIVFIDEIDAVGRHRGAGLGGGHDEREQTLNQLLVEMDGFDSYSGIIVLAATNRPDILDPALLRPGRFDRRVVVDYPDKEGRKKILQIHMRGKPVDSTVDVDVLADMTVGFSGADLENLVNEAALLAARKNRDTILMEDFEEAFEKVILGPKKSRKLREEDKKITAYHEAGHALVKKLVKHSDPIHKISIVPRGMALGYVMDKPSSDRVNYSKVEILDKIAGLLGGRVAEEVVFGHDNITTGAENDLQRATDLARKMIVEWGMSDIIGPMFLEEKKNEVFLGREIARYKNYSESTAKLIDAEVKRIIMEQYRRVKNMLEMNRHLLDEIAQTLIEKEVMTEEELDNIIKKHMGENGSDEPQQ
ncbi:ATP-dependent zinc metalloprotease FtsH [bacterium 3DAC]|nr:ATP-dependent metallopeptidase FtsH/Yme1/Tma family protein [Dictyoglomota bacterium]UZN23770.1 ATP-dependent zinc metalloprotease FtsH [bacterium 3DAC]